MIKAVKKKCLNILEDTNCSILPFHNDIHTIEVVTNVGTIGTGLGITQDDLEPIIIAAWFHDTGFSEVYHGHENVSKRLANDFLNTLEYDEDKLKIVLECIEATKMPQSPKSLNSEILCDSDMYHISQPNFFYRKLLIRREWEIFLNKSYSDKEWHLTNLQFIHDHQFFTPYGKRVMSKGKKINEEKVLKMLQYYD